MRKNVKYLKGTSWNKKLKYYRVERKELPPIVTAWMELESIMPSEAGQATKDKYHMISPRSGT